MYQDEKKRLIVIFSIISTIGILVFSLTSLKERVDNGDNIDFGKLVHKVAETFDAGVRVNGIEVISDQGCWVGSCMENVNISGDATSTLEIDGDNGGCIIFKDYNTASSTYCITTDGTLECSTDPCN